MKRWFLLLLASLPGLAAAEESRQVRDYWYSGAEISRYELTQARYGKEHQGHAEFIFVTEPFLTEKQVKHESGPGPSASALKLNAFRTFNTGIYSYRTMTSTFRATDLEKFPHAFKSNTSVQDWCGQVFQQYNHQPEGWKYTLHSYFQDEGERDEILATEALLEDALWLTLRLDPQKLPQGNLQLIPGALFSRFQHVPVKPEAAIAKLESDDKRSTYQVTYPKLGRQLTLHFDKDFPHVIREWSEVQRGSDAVTHAKLTHRLEQQDYWNHNAPDKTKLRRQLGLSPDPK